MMSTICELNDRMNFWSEGQMEKEGQRNRKYEQYSHIRTLAQKCWHLARRVPRWLWPRPLLLDSSTEGLQVKGPVWEFLNRKKQRTENVMDSRRKGLEETVGNHWSWYTGIHYTVLSTLMCLKLSIRSFKSPSIDFSNIICMVHQVPRDFFQTQKQVMHTHTHTHKCNAVKCKLSNVKQREIATGF